MCRCHFRCRWPSRSCTAAAAACCSAHLGCMTFIQLNCRRGRASGTTCASCRWPTNRCRSSRRRQAWRLGPKLCLWMRAATQQLHAQTGCSCCLCCPPRCDAGGGTGHPVSHPPPGNRPWFAGAAAAVRRAQPARLPAAAEPSGQRTRVPRLSARPPPRTLAHPHAPDGRPPAAAWAASKPLGGGHTGDGCSTAARAVGGRGRGGCTAAVRRRRAAGQLPPLRSAAV